jgi:hypothetical protein
MGKSVFRELREYLEQEEHSGSLVDGFYLRMASFTEHRLPGEMSDKIGRRILQESRQRNRRITDSETTMAKVFYSIASQSARYHAVKFLNDALEEGLDKEARVPLLTGALKLVNKAMEYIESARDAIPGSKAVLIPFMIVPSDPGALFLDRRRIHGFHDNSYEGALRELEELKEGISYSLKHPNVLEGLIVLDEWFKRALGMKNSKPVSRYESCMERPCEN